GPSSRQFSRTLVTLISVATRKAADAPQRPGGSGADVFWLVRSRLFSRPGVLKVFLERPRRAGHRVRRSPDLAREGSAAHARRTSRAAPGGWQAVVRSNRVERQ